MLKWKKHTFETISDTVESTTDILAGMAGKNRRIKYFTTGIETNMFIRIYRDAEQCVDFDVGIITVEHPLIPVDIPLEPGQLCKAGFFNLSAGDVTPTLTIGYEESDT